MKLLLIIGNGAVGKMTVGQELMKITNLRLFHNHMTIEPVLEVFGYLDFNIVQRLRKVFLEEFAKSENYGMIMTLMWAFDDPTDWNSVNEKVNIFREINADIYIAELTAPQEIRLQRNITENRLKHKASKRNIERSNGWIIEHDEKHRLESHDGEIVSGMNIPPERYIKIDNSDLPPEEAAKIIKERFSL
ncbi:MAG: shikimate kinase [Oscillospiraceae bacterium]|nr:shikimate kinase [Oscillospiraceae bacterium]